MAGFLPVGSSPVASSPTTNNGVSVQPDAASVVFEVQAGSEPTVEGVNAVEVWQLVRETLRSASTGTTQVVVRAMVREVLRSAAVSAGRRRMSLM